MKTTRIVLVAGGVTLLILGGVVLFGTVRAPKIVGLGSWLVLAIIAHDLVISAATFGVGFGLRKRRLPVAVIAIVQGALVVMSVFAIVVLPEVYKKSIGTKNPTVLPLDYSTGLVVLWVSVAALAAVLIAAYYAVIRRQKLRPSSSQA